MFIIIKACTDIFYKLYLHRTIKLINLQPFNEKRELFFIFCKAEAAFDGKLQIFWKSTNRIKIVFSLVLSIIRFTGRNITKVQIKNFIFTLQISIIHSFGPWAPWPTKMPSELHMLCLKLDPSLTLISLSTLDAVHVPAYKWSKFLMAIMYYPYTFIVN